MIKWEKMNATEQQVVEAIIWEIESGEISEDDDDIFSSACKWDGEYGFYSNELVNIDNVCEHVKAFFDEKARRSARC